MASVRAGAAALLLCVSSAASSSMLYPGQFLPNSAYSEYCSLVMGSSVHGKLDIFLDLTDPKSAKAWPTLKSAVRDNESTMEFVFHAIPLSASPTAIDFAKAAYLIADHSGGDAEVETFFDLAFSYHDSRDRESLASFQDADDSSYTGTIPSKGVSHQEARDAVDDLPDAGDLLAGWVLLSSSMDSHQYESGMRDSVFDDLFWHGQASSSSSSSPSSTYLPSPYLPLLGGAPAVYLDGEFLTYLDGEVALKNFEFFLSLDPPSKISDASLYGGHGAGYPLWLKLQDALLLLDEDLRQERHSVAGASTDDYKGDSFGYYTYVKHSLGDVFATGAAFKDEATLRSDLEEEEARRVAKSVLVGDGDVEHSTSLSPLSVSETSQLLRTHLIDDEDYFDDTFKRASC